MILFILFLYFIYLSYKHNSLLSRWTLCDFYFVFYIFYTYRRIRYEDEDEDDCLFCFPFIRTNVLSVTQDSIFSF